MKVGGGLHYYGQGSIEMLMVGCCNWLLKMIMQQQQENPDADIGFRCYGLVHYTGADFGDEGGSYQKQNGRLQL